MILSPAGLARWSSRRPRLVLGLWLATLILAVGAIAGLLGGALTSDDAVTASTESKRADALVFERRLVNPKPVDEIVIVRSGSLTVDEPAFRDFVRGLFAAGRASGAVASARSWYETRDPSLVSGDRHATIVPIVLGPNGDEGIEKVVALVREADRDSRFSAAVTGSFTLDRDFNEVSQHDLRPCSSAGSPSSSRSAACCSCRTRSCAAWPPERCSPASARWLPPSRCCRRSSACSETA